MNRPKTEAEERFEELVQPQKPFNRLRLVVSVAVVVLFFGAFGTADFQWSNLTRVPEALRITGLMFSPPDWEVIPDALTETMVALSMAWIGTLIGAVFSLPLGFLAATNLFGKGTVFVARQILNVFRAVPEIIFLVLFIPIFGLTPVNVALALGISSIGTLGKLTAEVIEGVDGGPVEAADASGASRIQRIRWAVFPQVIPEVIAVWLYRFEINIRQSAIAGAVGAGGIGTLLARLMGIRDWAAVGMCLIVLVAITLIVDSISGRIRRRIIAGPRQKGATGKGDGKRAGTPTGDDPDRPPVESTPLG